jgi:hypothetical protein
MHGAPPAEIDRRPLRNFRHRHLDRLGAGEQPERTFGRPARRGEIILPFRGNRHFPFQRFATEGYKRRCSLRQMAFQEQRHQYCLSSETRAHPVGEERDVFALRPAFAA